MTTVNEIWNLPDSEFDPDQDSVAREGQRFFGQGAQWQPYDGSTDWHWAKVDADQYIILAIAGGPEHTVVGMLAVAQGKVATATFFHVNWIIVGHEWRGRGIARALYYLAMKHLGPIQSGEEQTSGGRKNWARLAQTPGIEVAGLIAYEKNLRSLVPAQWRSSIEFLGKIRHVDETLYYCTFPVKAHGDKLVSQIDIPLLRIYDVPDVALIARCQGGPSW